LRTPAGTSWSAKNSDFDQRLIIDLGVVRNVTHIALQGRPHSNEYVTEYTISYGITDLEFADYKEPGGNVKVNNRSQIQLQMCVSSELGGNSFGGGLMHGKKLVLLFFLRAKTNVGGWGYYSSAKADYHYINPLTLCLLLCLVFFNIMI